MPPRRKAKRGARGAGNQPPKRTRPEAADEPAADSNRALIAAHPPAAFTLPSSSTTTSSCSSSPTASGHRWSTLPLELLVLVADCEPSYRLLLPLSSTCRHLYELIHEESVSGVVPSANSLQDVSARLSCWRQHPSVRVAVSRTQLLVGPIPFALAERDASFVSYVLTSLRHLPFLELQYSCASGSHAANLHALHHFASLRSLILLLPDDPASQTPSAAQDTAKQRNLASTLSTALLSLPSLVDLTVYSSYANASVLEDATLQRLTRERLLHITVADWQSDQLTTPVPTPGRRSRDKAQSTIYCNVQSVAINNNSGHYSITPRHICRLFPNVKHVALDSRCSLNLDPANVERGDFGLLLDLDSLHVPLDPDRAERLFVAPMVDAAVGCRLRCLVLSWDRDILHIADAGRLISHILALTPHLEQLAIVGGWGNEFQNDTVDRATLSSAFDLRSPLPKLTYLQLTGCACTNDIDYLLSSASPPAFAATLTHLELEVRWPDRRHAAALLPSLPALYPSLQCCRVRLDAAPVLLRVAADEVAAWRAMWAGVASQWGAAVKVDDVRQDRLDVAWRRAAGMAPVPDERLADRADLAAFLG